MAVLLFCHQIERKIRMAPSEVQNSTIFCFGVMSQHNSEFVNRNFRKNDL